MLHDVIYLALFLPLAGFLALIASSEVICRRTASAIACSTLLLSFFCFCFLLHAYTSQEIAALNFILYEWIPVDGMRTNFVLHLDHLSLLMALIITGIGSLIHFYSIGYMEDESCYGRYFACLNFFVFAMLLLVLAGNLLLLFVGWEGVGLASYLLIGFWHNKPEAAQAATKAFVVNRIGDVGFLIALLLTYHTFGTGNTDAVNRLAAEHFALGAPLMTLLTLLYFFGAVGKSAQLPLYTWLPDAMEGPTPVSALIHAATMVTAGVYLVVRLHPVYLLAPTTLHIIGIIGAVTALFAALCALAQTDLKRVLAYSTVSQLGFMFLACGATAFYSAMFHLTTHAFIKALLFLSAGNVVHMLHGTTEMAQMGGLRKVFSKTHWLFLIGVLALSGVPPFAAFFSKDMILEQEHLAGFNVLFYVGLMTSVLTGFYLMRAYCLTFGGELKGDKFLSVQEAPRIMLVPVALLALLSIGGGFLGFAYHAVPWLEQFLIDVGVSAIEHDLGGGALLKFSPEMWMAVTGSLLGVGSSAILYLYFPDTLGKPFVFFKNSFFINELYSKMIAQPLQWLAYNIAYRAEPRLFEGSIDRLVHLTDRSAGLLQNVQNGQIRSYMAWIAAGAAFLVVYLVS